MPDRKGVVADLALDESPPVAVAGRSGIGEAIGKIRADEAITGDPRDLLRGPVHVRDPAFPVDGDERVEACLEEAACVVHGGQQFRRSLPDSPFQQRFRLLKVLLGAFALGHVPAVKVGIRFAGDGSHGERNDPACRMDLEIPHDAVSQRLLDALPDRRRDFDSAFRALTLQEPFGRRVCKEQGAVAADPHDGRRVLNREQRGTLDSILDPFALGHIADDDRSRGVDSGRRPGRDGDLGGKHAAPFSHHLQLLFRAETAGQAVPECLPGSLRHDQFGHAPADGFLPAVAQDLLGGGVHQEDLFLPIDGDDGIRRHFDKGPVVCFGLPEIVGERLLHGGPPAFGLAQGLRGGDDQVDVPQVLCGPSQPAERTARCSHSDCHEARSDQQDRDDGVQEKSGSSLPVDRKREDGGNGEKRNGDGEHSLAEHRGPRPVDEKGRRPVKNRGCREQRHQQEDSQVGRTGQRHPSSRLCFPSDPAECGKSARQKTDRCEKNPDVVNGQRVIGAIRGADQPPGRKGRKPEGEHAAAQKQHIQKTAAKIAPDAQPGDKQAQARDECGVQAEEQPGGFEHVCPGPEIGPGEIEDRKEQDEQRNRQSRGLDEQGLQQPFRLLSFCGIRHDPLTP